MKTFWYQLTQVHLEKWSLKHREREVDKAICIVLIIYSSLLHWLGKKLIVTVVAASRRTL